MYSSIKYFRFRVIPDSLIVTLLCLFVSLPWPATGHHRFNSLSAVETVRRADRELTFLLPKSEKRAAATVTAKPDALHRSVVILTSKPKFAEDEPKSQKSKPVASGRRIQAAKGKSLMNMDQDFEMTTKPSSGNARLQALKNKLKKLRQKLNDESGKQPTAAEAVDALPGMYNHKQDLQGRHAGKKGRKIQKPKDEHLKLEAMGGSELNKVKDGRRISQNRAHARQMTAARRNKGPGGRALVETFR